jgi:hypothetical protein
MSKLFLTGDIKKDMNSIQDHFNYLHELLKVAEKSIKSTDEMIDKIMDFVKQLYVDNNTDDGVNRDWEDKHEESAYDPSQPYFRKD